MALGSTVIWEVRTTGDDENGGGYQDLGGVDYSQQDVAELSAADFACLDGSDVLTSATGGFTADMVGNIIQIASGTNFVVGFYRIDGFNSSNSLELDRSPVSGGDGSSGVGSVGGALWTPGKAAEVAVVSGQKIYVKSGTYTLTTSTPGATGPVVLANHTQILIEGYETTRGDLGAKPVIDAGAVTNVNLITADGNYDANQWIINLKADGNSQSGVSGFASLNSYSDTFYLCEAVDCPVYGFDNYGTFIRCLGDGCGCGFNAGSGGPRCMDCEAKNCVTDGFRSTASALLLVRCLARDNGGQGFKLRLLDHLVDCTAFNNTGDGFGRQSGTWSSGKLVRCLAVDNGGYGFNVGAQDATLIDCGGYNNTSGNLNPNPLLRAIGFQALAGDPFVDAAGGDFRLNNTAGAGAACRAAGGGIVGQTNNSDIGAVQHTDPAGGGGGMLVHPGTSGGARG